MGWASAGATASERNLSNGALQRGRTDAGDYQTRRCPECGLSTRRSLTANVVRGSRSAEDARRKVELFFSEHEVFQHKMADGRWLFHHDDDL